MHDVSGTARPADVADGMQHIIGDYQAFFADLRQRLTEIGIDIATCPISHLAYRTPTMAEYEQVRERIRRFSKAEVENVWNGRPINKLLLSVPLQLDSTSHTSLIELIPPRHQLDYPMGLEHAGVVVGATFEDFVGRFERLLTGRQDQGPFCQPAYVTFANNRTVKFYRWSLKDVVEKEGRQFLPPARR